MVTSLLDGADLAVLRAVADRLPGPFATVSACLVDGGALTHDPSDPAWDDRDRVVAAQGDAAAAIRAVLVAAGHEGDAGVVEAPAWETLPLAAGLAAASRLEGGAFGIWCLVDAEAVNHGAVWEALRLALTERLDTLTAVFAGTTAVCDEAERVLRAAGWWVDRASAGDPVEVLSGLDRVGGRHGPSALLAVEP